MDRNYPGPCSSCCTCPPPEFASVSRAASKSKCGFLDATTGKYYYQETIVSTGTDNAPLIGASGGCTMTQVSTNTAQCASSSTTWTGSGSSTSTGVPGLVPPCSATQVLIPGNAWEITAGEVPGLGGVGTIYGSGIGIFGYQDCAGEPDITRVVTYADEYTTAALQAYVVASLPAWGSLPPFGGGYPGELASAELNADSSGYSIMESQYQLAHPIPPTGIYILMWVERFTPDGGGAPTNTARSYTWDGAIPGDYNRSDPATWPKTSIFEVDHPASNGIITLHNLTVNCGGGATTLFS